MICVDWSAGAADPNYVRAAVNTRLVGKQVAILVENINESIGKSITPRTHIVGFSLGAHVAGFAGTQLKNLSRITGRFIVDVFGEEVALWKFVMFRTAFFRSGSRRSVV